MESEQDMADTFEGLEDAARPSLPSGKAASAPRAVPPRGGSSGGGSSGLLLPRDAPAFESGGRHILYCGTDLLMDGQQWHSSPRKHGNGGSLGRSSLGSAGGSGSGSHLLHQPHVAEVSGAVGGSTGLGTPAGAGAGAGGEGGDDDDDEEVLEMETDTPGGYHVSAVLTHHRDAPDPEEIIVEAHIRP